MFRLSWILHGDSYWNQQLAISFRGRNGHSARLYDLGQSDLRYCSRWIFRDFNNYSWFSARIQWSGQLDFGRLSVNWSYLHPYAD